MKKINVFQEFTDTDTKHEQVVYLDKYGFTPEQIAKWTGYAVSTIKGYVRKFAGLLEKACAKFYHVTKKAKAVLIGGRQLVYLFKFYNVEHELVCSKVGTTTRLPETRLQEELKSYRKSKDERIASIDHAEICSVIDCGPIPAEGAESETRAKFIRRWPAAFKKNDRFVGVDIPVRTFEKTVHDYLAGEVSPA